jgi:hypothetical protein
LPLLDPPSRRSAPKLRSIIAPALSSTYHFATVEKARERLRLRVFEGLIARPGWALTVTTVHASMTLFRLILEVASGRTKVWSDRWGIHNDLTLFTLGPVT